LAFLYLLLLISGLYTEEWAVWRHELYRQLPLLAVPLAFSLAVPLSGRQRYLVGCLFVMGATLIGGATVVRYLLDPDTNNELIMVGEHALCNGYFSYPLWLDAGLGSLLRHPAQS
jgi:O-antigen ligase